jgi:endo-1,4-beta-xylanase
MPYFLQDDDKREEWTLGGDERVHASYALPEWTARPGATIADLPYVHTHPPRTRAMGQPTLKEAANRLGIEIGINFPGLVDGKSPNNWESSPTIALEKRIAREHFTIASAGWQMYPGRSWPGPRRYDFEGADRFVAWCREVGLKVHGHGLGYAVRVDWLKRMPANTDAEKREVRAVFEDYVTRTAAHFAGRVHMWDVCNEQLLPAYIFNGYQTDASYWKAYQQPNQGPESGVEWYRRTFRLARDADPQARLILLDFNNEIVCPKSDRMLQLVTQLRSEGVPVDGVGFQMHLGTDLNRSKNHGLKDDDSYYAALKANLRRFAEQNLDLWITELDVRLDPAKDLRAELARQAEIYGRVTEIAATTPRMKGIKFWGIVDRDPWGRVIPERPNLFDEDGQPKPAFYAVRDALVRAAQARTREDGGAAALPRNTSATTPLARLRFTQDYFPGTRDPKGAFMGGTEAMWLAGHRGKLYAAIGYGQDQPGTDPMPGAQVLRKDAPGAPWVVDHTFGRTCMRVEALISFAFTTDRHGKPLAEPVRLLIASPSELTGAAGGSSVFVRNDTTGQWERSRITDGSLGARSFGSHRDKITGVHHLLAGLNRGGIHRGSYDPQAPGGIRWEPTPERTAEALPGKGRRIYDYSRVLCFAECNGDLYMAARITTDESGKPVDGGLYRRVDGDKPTWELVHRWTIEPGVLQSRFLRGLSAVPDPKGGKHQVLIANFEYPGLIARFDPTRPVVAAEQELDIKSFFNQAWNTPAARRRGAIAAYNRFLPVADPKTGEPLWLCGAWVELPGSPNPPNNGSCYLIRRPDGRYDWGYIYDPAHPVPAGQKLTGCRDIEPSPFPGEQGRVFYFCGYDGGAGPSHNTAWIYRGTLPAKP